MSLLSPIESDWSKAKSTGSYVELVAFWTFTLLAWAGLLFMGPLIVAANLNK